MAKSRTMAHGNNQRHIGYALRMRLVARLIQWTALSLLGLLVLWWGLMWAGQWPQPYGKEVRQISWQLGWQDRAYNVGVVVPARVFRSAQPDERLIEYLHTEFGIGRIITLNASRPNHYHARARALGIEIHRFDWSSKRLPPRTELEAALALIRDSEQPVLVHCTAGKDRTGYAIASYRLLEQNWPLSQALAEMDSYWHRATRKPWFQDELRLRAQPSS